MAYFVVRVELHELNSRQKPTWDDYQRLHIAMQQRRYWRVIQGGDNKWYHMPHATYFAAFDNRTKEQIREEAAAIVGSVWSKAGTLVTEGYSAWVGLNEATISEVQQLTR